MTYDPMKTHWIHHERKYPVDREKDPLGLNNACIPEAPAWLNEYHDKIQYRVWNKLFNQIPCPHSILDIGCGSGRWIKRLNHAGFELTGIDIQESLIEQNKKEMPDVRWFAGDFRLCQYNGELFDLITSVTVLQHIETYQLPTTISILRNNLKKGGHLIALENISYRSETCHGYDIGSWEYFFRSSGFTVLKKIPYDSGILLRLTDHGGLRWMGKYLRNFDLRYSFPRYARHCGFLLEAI